MSCSKIFSGDLPELTYYILKYFQNDFSTLHSCILVNRLWCRLAIPLLWENPFSIPTKNYDFINIYLHNLNGDLRTKLNEYKINDNLLPSNTMFNYPMFLKYLNTYRIVFSVNSWFHKTASTSKPGDRSLLGNLDLRSISNFKRLIHMSLIKIFIDSEVNLHTFEIEITIYYKTYIDNILEIILQNTNFIHNIRYLKLYTSIFIKNENSSSIENRITQIINSHQNLKKILLCHNKFPLYQPLLLSRHSNCSNTLNIIIFYDVNFKNIANLDKLFEQLNVLESVHIFYCSLNTGFIQQIINLTKPFKLKSLFIKEVPKIESLQSLLQKSGDYLENFDNGLGVTSLKKQQLFELIMKYCKNIKFLNLYVFGNKIFCPSFNLIENIKQNLNYLFVGACDLFRLDNDHIERSSIILRNLGQILPPKLEYLCLSFHIKAIDLEIFLKNSQNSFIKKLLINNTIQAYSDDIEILPCIKEHIMKKKRVHHLAVRIFVVDNYIGNVIRDLSNLKDEVNEFNLHNIGIQKYDDLCFNIYNFMKEIA
jgi:hypothetical protein